MSDQASLSLLQPFQVGPMLPSLCPSQLLTSMEEATSGNGQVGPDLHIECNVLAFQAFPSQDSNFPFSFSRCFCALKLSRKLESSGG